MIRIVNFLFLLNLLIYAQNSGTIIGKVSDQQTGEPLPFITVQLPELNKGTTTDENGIYQISSIPPGTYMVRFSGVGFMPLTKTDITITNSRPTTLDVSLSEDVLELSGVTVTAGYFENKGVNLNSTSSFGYEEIRRSPGGFEDVVRALSILPGVAQADAGRNDLIVRGGAPSENLYILDGFVIPNINHFGTQGATGGPLSFINLDYVSGTNFSTGGFSTSYGNKISSVLSIDLTEGRKDRFGGKATISASQFGLNLEGPVTNKSRFLFSARRSYLDFIFKAAGFGFVPEYYDVLNKFTYDFDNRSSLSFLFVGAFDNVKYFNDTDDKRFENSRVLGSDQINYSTGLRYKRIFSRGFYTVSLSRNHNDFDTAQRDSLLNPIFLNQSLEAENRFRTDIVYSPSNNLEFNGGIELNSIKFRANILLPNFRTSFGEVLPIDSVKSEKKYFMWSAYFNGTYKSSGGFSINLGIRSDYFDGIDKKYSFSPRISTAYSLNELITFNFSSGLYHQTPSYVWLLAGNSNLKQIEAWQNIVSFQYLFRADAIVKLEFYDKTYSDYPASVGRPYIVLSNSGAGFAGAEENFTSFGLENLVSSGSGISRGIELSVQKKLSEIPCYGLFSLTINSTKFKAIDQIERYGSYHQSFLLNLSGGYKFNEEWETSLKFRFATGRPYTPYNSDGTQSIVNYNSARLDNLHSLDVRVDKRWFWDKYTFITYIDLQNIYNNKNLSGYRWNQREKKVERSESIGLLPTIGISLEF